MPPGAQSVARAAGRARPLGSARRRSTTRGDPSARPRGRPSGTSRRRCPSALQRTPGDVDDPAPTPPGALPTAPAPRPAEREGRDDRAPRRARRPPRPWRRVRSSRRRDRRAPPPRPASRLPRPPPPGRPSSGRISDVARPCGTRRRARRAPNAPAAQEDTRAPARDPATGCRRFRRDCVSSREQATEQSVKTRTEAALEPRALSAARSGRGFWPPGRPSRLPHGPEQQARAAR